MHRFGIIVFVGWVSVGLHCTAICAGEGFVTATFGNSDNARYPKTLQVEKDLLRFDVSALPRKGKIVRAILRFPFRSDWGHHSAVRLIPVDTVRSTTTSVRPSGRAMSRSRPSAGGSARKSPPGNASMSTLTLTTAM
jgi:hypothetical protein